MGDRLGTPGAVGFSFWHRKITTFSSVLPSSGLTLALLAHSRRQNTLSDITDTIGMWDNDLKILFDA